MSASLPTSGPIAISGPLTIPELLDRTFRALRARFGVIILSAAMVIVPLGVITTLLTGRFMTSYVDFLQFSLTATQPPDAAFEEFFGDMISYIGVFMIIGILSAFCTTLVTLMSIHHIERFLHGESSTMAEGWRVAIRRLLPMVGMQILQYVAIGIVTVVVLIAVGIVFAIIALIFGGAMAGLGNDTANVILMIGLVIGFVVGYILLIVLMLAPAAYFSARWLAAGPSLLIEGLGPATSLQRSWNLTKGRFWRSILFVILLTTLGFLVIGLPISSLQWISMMLMPSQLGLVLTVSTVASYLLNLLYQPFYATGMVLFYYDLRVRAEAYDVALRVSALEAEVAPDAPPA